MTLKFRSYFIASRKCSAVVANIFFISVPLDSSCSDLAPLQNILRKATEYSDEAKGETPGSWFCYECLF